MLKYLSIVSILIVIAVSASAQIYLRKDDETQVPSANKAPQQNQTAPAVPQQPAPQENAPSQNALNNARNVANTCLGGQWESQPCLKAVSENNLMMASSYSASLKQAGKEIEAQFIKETCAASTAATQEEFPAFAMRSAFVECVNAIPSAANATGILPDQSQFQLLVVAIQCLDKGENCVAIEQSLAQYKTQ